MVFWFSSCGLVSFLFLSWLFCVFFFLFFSFLSKKTHQNRTQQETQKPNMQKKGQNQLAQLCSQIVFLIFGGWATKMCFCWKHYKNRGLNIFWERKKGKPLTELLSWKAVQGWAENLSNYVAQHNWTDFQLNKMCFFSSFSFFSYQNHFLPAERRRFVNIKRKRKIWTDFQLKKGQFLDRFSAPQQRCIYI